MTKEDQPLDRRKTKFYLAPMVRYSKLAFRKLVRLYDVDCCYTPMIYAKNFLESEHCRSSEFSTTPGIFVSRLKAMNISILPDDRPLIVQFASDDPFVFGSAAELVYKYATGVDLNCGCPKSDVRAKGFGSFLLNRPELLADMVRQCRARIHDPDFTVIFLLFFSSRMCKTCDDDLPDLFENTRTVSSGKDYRSMQKGRNGFHAEKAGVSHLTVHGRTPSMRCEPVDYDAIRIVKESVSVPVIANGDVTQRSQALEIAETTGVDGVMAANGLLYNPALFAGYEYTPASCIRDF
ncbi:unnamed protein product, partial [Cylicostephanus goldi]